MALYKTRGIKNNNPFNIKRSADSWLGKTAFNSDKVFERFTNMNYGLRAGILLLRNAYLAKGYDTVEKIINRYAPASENDSQAYIAYVYKHVHITYGQPILLQSIQFYELCKAICKYESDYDLSYDRFRQVINKFNLGF